MNQQKGKLVCQSGSQSVSQSVSQSIRQTDKMELLRTKEGISIPGGVLQDCICAGALR